MLDKLEEIANRLDAKGMHKEADTITNVMKRVAGFWNRNPEHKRRHENMFESIDEPNLQDALSGDNMDMMRIHSTLRAMGIDPSGMSDSSALSVYQAMMGEQQMSAYAQNDSKFKRLG